MAFLYTWNETFENLPTNDNYGYELDDYIRKLQVAVRERMAIDHIWKVGATDGYHKQVTLGAISKPTHITGYGIVYTKDVGSGVIELFYEDAAGNELQLTAAGAQNITASVPSGSKMLFYQDTAPTGWTIENTINDQLVYITKGSVAGGNAGGALKTGSTWTIPTGQLAADSHTLTEAEMPNHTHSIAVRGNFTNGEGGVGGSAVGWASSINTSYTGGSTGHTHTVSSSGAAMTWRPSGHCCIICTKD